MLEPETTFDWISLYDDLGLDIEFKKTKTTVEAAIEITRFIEDAQKRLDYAKSFKDSSAVLVCIYMYLYATQKRIKLIIDYLTSNTFLEFLEKTPSKKDEVVKLKQNLFWFSYRMSFYESSFLELIEYNGQFTDIDNIAQKLPTWEGLTEVGREQFEIRIILPFFYGIFTEQWKEWTKDIFESCYVVDKKPVCAVQDFTQTGLKTWIMPDIAFIPYLINKIDLETLLAIEYLDSFYGNISYITQQIWDSQENNKLYQAEAWIDDVQNFFEKKKIELNKLQKDIEDFFNELEKLKDISSNITNPKSFVPYLLIGIAATGFLYFLTSNKEKEVKKYYEY